MKSMISLLVLAIFAGCKSDVQCQCHTGSTMKQYDLGRQSDPVATNFQAPCDTLGAHDSLDSCYVHILRE